MRSRPLTLSPLAIADFDTPHRSASSRADHPRKARAARNWAPVISASEFGARISLDQELEVRKHTPCAVVFP
jgi:hypothetical protein